mmetsp:Transcript_36025/g.111003  ORF Transcript_36025/g.111003 Transcript_36025/m.111003 type:complete len:360 (+) Transcript_36025:135-1214(+)
MAPRVTVKCPSSASRKSVLPLPVEPTTTVNLPLGIVALTSCSSSFSNTVWKVLSSAPPAFFFFLSSPFFPSFFLSLSSSASGATVVGSADSGSGCFFFDGRQQQMAPLMRAASPGTLCRRSLISTAWYAASDAFVTTADTGSSSSACAAPSALAASAAARCCAISSSSSLMTDTRSSALRKRFRRFTATSDVTMRLNIHGITMNGSRRMFSSASTGKTTSGVRVCPVTWYKMKTHALISIGTALTTRLDATRKYWIFFKKPSSMSRYLSTAATNERSHPMNLMTRTAPKSSFVALMRRSVAALRFLRAVICSFMMVPCSGTEKRVRAIDAKTTQPIFMYSRATAMTSCSGADHAYWRKP